MLTMDQHKCIRMMRQWLGLSLAEIRDDRFKFSDGQKNVSYEDFRK